MKRFRLPLAVFAVLAVAYTAGWLDRVESNLDEARFRLVQRPAGSELVIVAIDPESLSRLPLWPWPRSYHAAVIDELLSAGATSIAFDVDFSSRSSAAEDRELARSLEDAGDRVILPTFQQWVSSGEPGQPGLAATHPLPDFRQHARLASINIQPDRDGLARRYSFSGLEQGEIPSLAAALAGRPATLPPFHIDFGIQPGTLPALSFVDVITGNYDRELVSGRMVLIGATAVELGDIVTVPVHAVIPGVVLQALAYESMAQGRTLRRLPLATILGITLLLALGTGLILPRWPWRRALALAAATCALLFSAGVAVQRLFPVRVETSPFILVVLGTCAGVLVQQIDQQKLRLLFQQKLLNHKDVFIGQVMENSLDAIITLSEDDHVETCNGAAEAMFQLPAGEIVGQPLGKLIVDAAASVRLDINDQQHATETVGMRADGTTFPLDVVSSRIELDSRQFHLVLLRDLTERKAQQKALEHQATHDALTDLPNRFMLKARMQRTLDRARRKDETASFLILDLDRFKEINDTLGHHVGDLMLKQIAYRLRDALDRGDFMARLGGDEFAVLLPRSDLERARSVAERLLRALDSPFHIEGLSLNIGVSIGIALFPAHGDDTSSLLKKADVAMYFSKRHRVGVSVYDADKDLHSVRNLTLIGDLRRAIEDDGLTLSFQPKLSCADDRVVGLEALVRWTHPQHGPLPPAEFVSLAENTGLIRPLTRWVLESALRYADRMQREGLAVPISVNLSAFNLREDDLPWTVRHLLGEHDVPPSLLNLEITESVIMEDPQRALDIVTELNSMGLTISIDDFGTGYSSLSYLKKLPATELKIDRSFVMDMDTVTDDALIVHSIIELAHNLGLRVVAEGVETESTWAQLKGLQCDYGQGYLFSKPLPPAQMIAWLRGSNGITDIPLAPLPGALRTV